MGILLTHWHCILPAIVIVIVSVLMNRKKSKDSEK